MNKKDNDINNNVNKRNHKRLILCILILLFVFSFALFNLVFIRKKYLNYLNSISIAFIIFITLIVYLLFGFRRDKINIMKKNCIYTTLIIILSYFIIFYFSGVLFGFLHNSYSSSLIVIASNIFFPLIFLLSVELLRYILINSTKYTKTMIILTTLVFSFYEVVAFYNFFDHSTVGIFKFYTIVLFPVIAKNLLCGYFDGYVTIRLSFIYRLIFDLYIFIIPIFPDCGDYIQCVLSILLPYIIYFFISKNINMYDHYIKNDYIKIKNSRVSDSIFIGILFIFVCLISCLFPVFIMSVGSESMVPALNKGDGILAYKVNDSNKIKKGDIIVYNSNNNVIIHRVNKVIKKNNKIVYETKGDANNTADIKPVELKNIKGKVLLKIPFIGYPSVLLNKLLKYKM